MLVFLDDSGDPGFKVKKGSSPCFVIALVMFDDPLQMEECAVEIKKLRRKLRLNHQFEFYPIGRNGRISHRLEHSFTADYYLCYNLARV